LRFHARSLEAMMWWARLRVRVHTYQLQINSELRRIMERNDNGASYYIPRCLMTIALSPPSLNAFRNIESTADS